MIHTGLEAFADGELIDRLPVDASVYCHEMARRLLARDDREADYLAALDKAREAEAAGRRLAEALDGLNRCEVAELPATIEELLGKRAEFMAAADAFHETDAWAP